MLNVRLHFRRRTLFFSFNFIIPSMIITVCSIFGFILPPESGEKVGLRKHYIENNKRLNFISFKFLKK